MRTHAFVAHSRANGPGRRAVIWFQGCTLGCSGCFNPDTHDPSGGEWVSVPSLRERVRELGDSIAGVTITGGEPFQQREALHGLIENLGRTCIVFSGFTLREILALPESHETLAHIDVLIAGRYDRQQPMSKGLRGSANQEVHFLTNRYGPRDLLEVPDCELILQTDGSVVVSGIAPWRPTNLTPS